jgi:hypothetical protein
LTKERRRSVGKGFMLKAKPPKSKVLPTTRSLTTGKENKISL